MKNLKKLTRENLKTINGGVMESIIRCCKMKTCPTNPYCLRVVTPV